MYIYICNVLVTILYMHFSYIFRSVDEPVMETGYTVAFKRVQPPTRKLHHLSLTTATGVVFLCCYSYF